MNDGRFALSAAATDGAEKRGLEVGASEGTSAEVDACYVPYAVAFFL